jgi:prevent-host-death family protein
MKVVSILELKRRLSAILAEAAVGVRIVVTRHGKPVVTISSAGSDHLHVGSKVGRGSLKPLFRRATEGKYLEFLAEDRRGDPDGR